LLLKSRHAPECIVGLCRLSAVSFVLFTARPAYQDGLSRSNRDSSALRAREMSCYGEASLSACPIQGPLSPIAASIDAIRKVRSGRLATLDCLGRRLRAGSS